MVLTVSLTDMNSNVSHCITLGISQPEEEHLLVANPTRNEERNKTN